MQPKMVVGAEVSISQRLVRLGGGHVAGLTRFGFATILAVAGGRFGRRAALRGLVSAGAASLAAKLVAVGGGGRGWAASLPAPGAAAAAGMAVGGALELPWTAVPLGGLAISGTCRDTSVRRRAGPLVGAALGAAVAVGSRSLWPVAPRSGADLSPVRIPAQSRPSPTGEGLVVVLNPGAGSSPEDDLAATLREALPDARVVALDEGADLTEALRDAAAGASALGMAGGDGSLNAAAGVAYDHDLPLMAIPAGTLNHLARDLGLDSVDQAIDAVRRGDLVAMDVAVIDGRPFLNTASFGSYADLVDARELLEDRLGKWPALVVALVRVLRHGQPTTIEIDGERFPLWMIFIGNCCYHPSGFAPTWRERLDDGRLDVRVVSGRDPWARTRLVAAVLTGRLGRCRVYQQRATERLEVVSPDGGIRLACDGETFEGSRAFTVTKQPRPLHVYVPHQDNGSDRLA